MSYRGNLWYVMSMVVVFLLIVVLGEYAAGATEKQRKLDLSLAEVLDTLADYAVVYDSSDEFCSQWAGLTEPYKRKITLCGQMDLGWRRATLIHELLHAASARRSDRLSEPYTEDEIKPAVEKIYEEVYGR